jgi:hypothetical protein
MASTRAIARALRSFTNVGLTALEELGDLNDVLGNKSGKAKPKAVKKSSGKTKASAKPAKAEPKDRTKKSKTGKTAADKSQSATASEPKAEPKNQSSSSQPKMSEAQKRAIYNLSRRRGISVEELETMATDAYGCEVENLNSKDASTFIRNLQQAA